MCHHSRLRLVSSTGEHFQRKTPKTPFSGKSNFLVLEFQRKSLHEKETSQRSMFYPVCSRLSSVNRIRSKCSVGWSIWIGASCTVEAAKGFHEQRQKRSRALEPTGKAYKQICQILFCCSFFVKQDKLTPFRSNSNKLKIIQLICIFWWICPIRWLTTKLKWKYWALNWPIPCATLPNFSQWDSDLLSTKIVSLIAGIISLIL